MGTRWWPRRKPDVLVIARPGQRVQIQVGSERLTGVVTEIHRDYASGVSVLIREEVHADG